METTNYKKYTWMAGTLALVTVSFGAFAFGLSNLDAVKHPNGQVASVTVTGEGEVTAAPDIATISLTVRESGKTVPEAQKAVEAEIAKINDAVGKLGVDKKDVKTTSYIVTPKYESTQMGACTSYICPPVKQVITGYEVAESLSVKIRKVDTAGDVLSAVGAAGATEINGPDFTVDDMDKAKADAKAIAIKKAQAKAEATASALGMSLGTVMSFSEDNGGMYAPMMYRASAGMVAMDAKTESVTLPQGESVIKSQVNITYTLK
jgi:hypothetical protein